MPLDQQRVDIKIIFTLTLVHFIGDFYNSFIIPLLPLFIDKFSLTLAQAGLIAGLSRFLAFIVQPPVGYLADRYPTRFFSLGGPLLVMVFISLLGVAPTFWLLLVFVSFGSIGSSMFHPTVAGMVSRYSGRHLGLSMSVFIMGGTLAFGAGPLFIAWFVKNFGLQATPLTMIIGLVVMVFLFKTVPLPKVEGLSKNGLVGSIREVFGATWKPVVLIWLVMVLRAFVSQSYLTFMPVLYAKEGYSLISIGSVVSLFTVAGAFSGLAYGIGGLMTPVTGMLADYFSIRQVLSVLAVIPLITVIFILFLPREERA